MPTRASNVSLFWTWAISRSIDSVKDRWRSLEIPTKLSESSGYCGWCVYSASTFFVLQHLKHSDNRSLFAQLLTLTFRRPVGSSPPAGPWHIYRWDFEGHRLYFQNSAIRQYSPGDWSWQCQQGHLTGHQYGVGNRVRDPDFDRAWKLKMNFLERLLRIDSIESNSTYE